LTTDGFRFRDGERLIVFGEGVLDQAPELISAQGLDGYALLTTERAQRAAPAALLEGAGVVLHVAPGPVPECAAAVRDRVEGRPVVTFGGGRVVDAGKAVAAADGLRTGAIPTTLAGSSFTPFHRMPAGVDGYGLVRPVLAVCEPGLMASAPMPDLAATAMNALAHASESLYAPGANPVSEGAALRGAALIATGLASDARGHGLALGALLGGYAVGTTGLGLHHALCQTIVRTAGTPHAQTNAVMLPHSLRFMAPRASDELCRLARALGREGTDPTQSADAVTPLAARAGATRLGELGLAAEAIPAIVEAALSHRGIAGMDAAPTRSELTSLLGAAL